MIEAALIVLAVLAVVEFVLWATDEAGDLGDPGE